MITLSLHQPWASLWVHGLKKIETRSWAWRRPTPCYVAVHAAKKWNAELSDLCYTEPFQTALHKLSPVPDALPFGEIVGVVRLTASLPIVDHADLVKGRPCIAFDDENILRVWEPFTFCKASGHSGDGYKALAENEAAFGNYAPGRYGFLTDWRCVLPEPVPCVGRQGPFRLSDDMVARFNVSLPAL